MIQYRVNVGIITTKNTIVEGPIIKENPLTVWTKTPDGKHIKRHKIKHRVVKIKSLKT